MPDEVRCPGGGHLRSAHQPSPLQESGCYACGTSDGTFCTLTPAEIDAVLAMRAGLPPPPTTLRGTAHPRETAGALAGYEFYGDRTPFVSCEDCGIVRNAAIVRDPDVCPSCGVVGRQPVVT